MATTTNFGWTTPDNTDAVTNGALAIRTLADEIDATVAGISGEWISGGIYQNGDRGSAFDQTTATWVTYVPFIVPNAVTLASVSVYVSDSATATSYLGVYSANATTGLPDTLVASFGSFSGSTTGVKTISTSQSLTANVYWFAVKLNQITSYQLYGAGVYDAPVHLFASVPDSIATRLGRTSPYAALTYAQSSSGALESSAGTFANSTNIAPYVVVAVA